MSAIKKELASVTRLEQEDGEPIQEYLTRLAKAISDLDNDEYYGMSKKTKAWADDAVNKFNDNAEIPGFPDEKKGRDRDEPEQEGENMPATREADEDEDKDRGSRRKSSSKTKDRDEAPARKQASAKSKSKDRDEAPARSAKTKSNGDGAKSGAIGYVRELLAKDPNISVDDIAKKAEGKGFEIGKSTINTTRSGFRQDVKALQDAGALKRNLISD